MPRQPRLKRLRKIASKNRDDETSLGRHHNVKEKQSIPTYGDDILEEDLLYSEEGNLSDFIVDDAHEDDESI